MPAWELLNIFDPMSITGKAGPVLFDMAHKASASFFDIRLFLYNSPDAITPDG